MHTISLSLCAVNRAGQRLWLIEPGCPSPSPAHCCSVLTAGRLLGQKWNTPQGSLRSAVAHRQSCGPLCRHAGPPRWLPAAPGAVAGALLVPDKLTQGPADWAELIKGVEGQAGLERPTPRALGTCTCDGTGSIECQAALGVYGQARRGPLRTPRARVGRPQGQAGVRGVGAECLVLVGWPGYLQGSGGCDADRAGRTTPSQGSPFSAPLHAGAGWCCQEASGRDCQRAGGPHCQPPLQDTPLLGSARMLRRATTGGKTSGFSF